MFRRAMIAGAAALVVTTSTWSTGDAAPPPADPADHLSVYNGVVDLAGLSAIVALGVDRHEVQVTPVSGEPGLMSVEVIISGAQAAQLADAGATLTAKDASGQRIGALATGVFRPYSGPGGLQEEMQIQAAAHPKIAKLEVIGRTWQGKEIVAVKVTKNARTTHDGKKPATVYVGAQHAREWITPEMVRRLLDHILSNYGTDPTITRLVNSTELWFVPVANPDGYDYTFTPDNRLWRKNLRDNDGDGQITLADGVDLNRNLPTRWGYDNEGSSPDPFSDTYRGPSPGSEPESKALDQLFKRIRPEFFINYHSAAELLLHGIGWQVATPSPDDVIYEAMVGDDAVPAIPGYDPDIAAELYVTNGDIDSHMQEKYGTLGFTPEMTTCETASDSNPDDRREAGDCESGFNFPDDEGLIDAEFQKNIPFALAVGKSALDPDDPVSVVGLDTPDFQVDRFPVSYGDKQTVAVVAKRALKNLRVEYRINGGRVKTTFVREWKGGERYGMENDVYYAEYRGTIKARAGDTVEVWFSGRASKARHARRVASDHFSYKVVQDTGHEVLVIANEDYTGVNPTYPAGTVAPKYLDEHVDALLANGVTPDVWDVDAQGVPHDLGVLSHYDIILWYLGDNRLTQDPEDELTEFFGGGVPDLSVAERQQYLTMSVRDFLNEGGKLAYAGETAAYYGTFGGGLGGIYYGLDGAPELPCEVNFDPFSDCLLLADDFTQYYLGAYSRNPLSATGVIGTEGSLTGAEAPFGGAATVGNPVDEAGALVPTSDVLPVAQFPQFASGPVADYVGAQGPFIPVEGTYVAEAPHADNSYMRLARTYDLSAVTAGQAPTFTAEFSFDVEQDYDHVIVEAHTVGLEDWTTLADLGGNTSNVPPAECEAGFLLEEHPHLAHYLTLGTPCGPVGDSGSWNSFTGSSGGWLPVEFDLSAYAGQQVEIVVSYVTDPFTGGVGLLVDDTALVVGGTATQAEGFEAGLGAWSVPGAPASSPGNATDFGPTIGLGGIHSVISTRDTVLFGFGLEQLESATDRAAIVGAILDHLG